MSAHIAPLRNPSLLPMSPITPPVPGSPPTRVLELTIPPSDAPRLLVLECDGPAAAVEHLVVRMFKIEG